jgi:hypothetical protein
MQIQSTILLANRLNAAAFCGGRMLIALRFEGACRSRKAPSAATGFDTS